MSKLRLFTLSLFLVSCFYIGLGIYPLLNNNEGLYAEVAREMIVLGNYTIPHLNFVPYLEKPPLLYWLISGSMHSFGINAFAARFVTATAGLGTCLCLLMFATQLLSQRIAWLAAIILATSIGFQLFSREVFFDVLLTACFTGAMTGFYYWYQTNSKSGLRVSYGFVGLALLTKGLLSLALAGGIVIIFMLSMRTPRQKIRQFFDGWGLLLFLLVAVPWHVAASIAHSDFAWYYFIHEQVLRFLNLREPHDYYSGNIFYYLPRVFISFWPWCWLLPVIIMDFKKSLPLKNHTAQAQQGLSWFLWLWFLLPLIFFSCSSAKANYYMVLGMPPLTLLLAIKVNDYWHNKKNEALVISLTLAVLLLLVTFGSALLCLGQKIPQYAALIPLTKIFGIFVLVFACAIATAFYFRRKTIVLFSGLVISSIILLMFLVSGLPLVANNLSEASLVSCLKQQAPRPLYSYEEYEQFSSLLFYSQQRLIIIDNQSNDLAYGKQYASPGWFITSAKFGAVLTQQKIHVAVAKDKLAAFKRLFPTVQFHTVCQNTELTILDN